MYFFLYLFCVSFVSLPSWNRWRNCSAGTTTRRPLSSSTPHKLGCAARAVNRMMLLAACRRLCLTLPSVPTRTFTNLRLSPCVPQAITHAVGRVTCPITGQASVDMTDLSLKKPVHVRPGFFASSVRDPKVKGVDNLKASFRTALTYLRDTQCAETTPAEHAKCEEDMRKRTRPVPNAGGAASPATRCKWKPTAGVARGAPGGCQSGRSAPVQRRGDEQSSCAQHQRRSSHLTCERVYYRTFLVVTT